MLDLSQHNNFIGICSGLTNCDGEDKLLYAGEQKKRLDAAMRQSHAVHVLREISHQQQSDIELMQHEIARWLQRSKASFAAPRPVQPDIIYSL